MSSSTRASSSVTLGSRAPGRPPIALSRDGLHNSIRAAAGWVGPGPPISVPFRADGAVLRITTCLQHGLIGVSRAVLLAIGACAEEVQRKTPVLLIGEPGVELEAVARCIYRSAKPPLPNLRCAGLTEDAVSGDWPSRIVQEALVNNRALLLTDIDCAPLAAQRKLFDEIEAHRAFLRVLATTHKSIDSLESMAEEGHLLPELLQLLCVEGREIAVPPLFLRPEDVPLLFYYYVQRFRAGDYSAERGEVKGIDPMLLYFAAGLRWRGNLGELERFVVRASRAAARTDGWLSVKPGGDYESPTWPKECPFVLSLPAFVQAMKSRPELLHTIPVEDLPGYDLRGLLEGVDDHSDSADRGRWTIEARLRYLGEERRTDESLAPLAVDDEGVQELTVGAWAVGIEPEGPSTRERVQHQSDSDEFSSNPDYSSVKLGRRAFLLKGDATEVVRILHMASQSGHEWVQKDRIATEINRETKDFRVRDVFSDRETYEALVEGNGKGNYRLR
jgi:hypothetical protein